jgi:uncharacterized Fe-S cluster protein YjdI
MLHETVDAAELNVRGTPRLFTRHAAPLVARDQHLEVETKLIIRALITRCPSAQTR